MKLLARRVPMLDVSGAFSYDLFIDAAEHPALKHLTQFTAFSTTEGKWLSHVTMFWDEGYFELSYFYSANKESMKRAAAANKTRKEILKSAFSELEDVSDEYLDSLWIRFDDDTDLPFIEKVIEYPTEKLWAKFMDIATWTLSEDGEAYVLDYYDGFSPIYLHKVDGGWELDGTRQTFPTPEEGFAANQSQAEHYQRLKNDF